MKNRRMLCRLMLCFLAGTVCACASVPEGTDQKSKTAENVYRPKSPVYTALAPGKTGELAYTVERLAKESGCELYENAHLMAKRPGIQFYRISCTDGSQILYRCEMRQCRMAD